jgi:hypothetical protein
MKPEKQTQVAAQFRAESWQESVYSEMAQSGKLSRAAIINIISGEIEGRGELEYLLAYPGGNNGAVRFTGIERIVGRMGVEAGSLVLRHEGLFSPDKGVDGSLEILPEYGSGDFVALCGRGTISAKPGEHGGEYILHIERSAKHNSRN